MGGRWGEGRKWWGHVIYFLVFLSTAATPPCWVQERVTSVRKLCLCCGEMLATHTCTCTRTNSHTHTVLLPPDMKSSPSTHCLKEARVPPQTFQQQQLCSQSSFPSHILQGSTHHKDGSSPHKESHTHHPEGSSSFASPIITSCDGPHLLEGRSTERNEGREVEPHPGHTQPGQRMNTPASLKEGGGVSLDSHPKDKTTTPKDDPSISAAMTGLSSGPSRHNAGSQADQFHTPKSSPPSTPRPSPPPTPQPPPTIGCIVKCPPRINGVQTFFSLVSHRYLWVLIIMVCGSWTALWDSIRWSIRVLLTSTHLYMMVLT